MALKTSNPDHPDLNDLDSGRPHPPYSPRTIPGQGKTQAATAVVPFDVPRAAFMQQVHCACRPPELQTLSADYVGNTHYGSRTDARAACPQDTTVLHLANPHVQTA